MADSQLYCWLVKQGRIQLWRDGDAVMIETDTEGSGQCVLTREDALEIATILYHLAQGTDGY